MAKPVPLFCVFKVVFFLLKDVNSWVSFFQSSDENCIKMEVLGKRKFEFGLMIAAKFLL